MVVLKIFLVRAADVFSLIFARFSKLVKGIYFLNRFIFFLLVESDRHHTFKSQNKEKDTNLKAVFFHKEAVRRSGALFPV